MRDLIRANQFREDLYYRLAVLQLTIPPLDQRKEDVPELVQYFLYVKSHELDMSCPEIDDSALTYLASLDYPGNVRQLGNFVERLLVLYEGVKPIDMEFTKKVLQQELDGTEAHHHISSGQTAYNEALDIQEALRKCRGRRGEAAKLLQISTSTLWRKMKKYGIDAGN